MEQSEEELTRNHLWTLPIWEFCDSLKEELNSVGAQIKKHIVNQAKRINRLDKLPTLNLDNQPRVPNTSNDIQEEKVYTYHKFGEQYFKIDSERYEELRKLAERDPFRDESLFMLEEKVKLKEEVFAMVRPGKAWVKCTVVSVFLKPGTNATRRDTRVTLTLRPVAGNNSKLISVNKFSVARIQAHKDRLKPSKRVIAGLTTSCMMPGIVGEEPVDYNKQRYLIHMDNGSSRYFNIDQVMPILGQSSFPWFDHKYLSDENLLNAKCLYLIFSIHPQKHFLKTHRGDRIQLLRGDQVVPAMVMQKDCSVIRIVYRDQVEESIYTGNPRLMKRDQLASLSMNKLKDIDKFSDRLCMHLHLYEEASKRALNEDLFSYNGDKNKKIVVSSTSRNIAKKSTSKRPKLPEVMFNHDTEPTTNVIDCEKPEGNMRNHKCSPNCLKLTHSKDETNVKDIINEFLNMSDLKVPLTLGWKRYIRSAGFPRNKQSVVYETPCGKLIHSMNVLKKFLQLTQSKLDVDYFTFEVELIIDKPQGDQRAYWMLENMAFDAKTGKPLENKNIRVQNKFNEERLPVDFEYSKDSFPHFILKKNNFDFNVEFKSSCDCDQDCLVRATCNCQNLNEESLARNPRERPLIANKCQYVNKRLVNKVVTGIFECNSLCKCSSKCPNRVVQNGIRFRFEIQKTLNKGWGIITLDGIPRGAFVCTYAAELLDDADQYGDCDMYYADLDFVTINEDAKLMQSDSDEGFDVSDEDNSAGDSPIKTIKSSKRVVLESDTDTSDTSESPLRDSAQKQSRQVSNPIKKQTPATNSSKFRKIHEVLNSHDFTLDGRLKGNIGRFFNHSCDPNLFPQNVFIETHDLRLPVVAFFSTRNIQPEEELTWDYNYKIDATSGRRIDCHCGASNCRGRIL